MYEIVNNKDQNRTSTRLIHTLAILKSHSLKKVLLCFISSSKNRLLYILREVRRHYNVVVEGVFYKFSATLASMTIKNTENLDFGPVLDSRLLCWRLDYVEDDCYSVFIGFADGAYIGVGGEGADCAEGFGAYF